MSSSVRPTDLDPAVGPLNAALARNQLGALLTPGRAQDPKAVAMARTKMATAKIYKTIQESLAACPHPLHPAQVAFLVSLIESAGEK